MHLYRIYLYCSSILHLILTLSQNLKEISGDSLCRYKVCGLDSSEQDIFRVIFSNFEKAPSEPQMTVHGHFQTLSSTL